MKGCDPLLNDLFIWEQRTHQEDYLVDGSIWETGKFNKLQSLDSGVNNGLLLGLVVIGWQQYSFADHTSASM